MPQKINLTYLFFLLFSTMANAEALSLLDSYEMAIHYDASAQSAQKDNAIQQFEIKKAKSAFMPQVSAQIYQGVGYTTSTTPGIFGGRFTQNQSYDSGNNSLSVKQSLFNKSNYAILNQAKDNALKSDASLVKSNLDLMARVSASYLDILMSLDNIEFSDLQIQGTESQLTLAQERFKAGVGAMTEVYEANANLESAHAKRIEWQNILESSKRTLESYIGIYPSKVLRLDVGKLPMAKPNPDNIDYWINEALEKNPDIVAARYDVQIASAGVDKSIAGHYPTVDLIASKSYTKSQNDYTIGSKYSTDSFGIQIQIPLYSGGYFDATTSQSIKALEKSRDDLSNKQRSILTDIRKYFNEIINNLSRIRAYESAVDSNRFALIGAQNGFEAGFRTNTEILSAQDKLYSAIRDLSKERYSFIYNKILLKQSAGGLTMQDIQEISGWFSAEH